MYKNDPNKRDFTVYVSKKEEITEEEEEEEEEAPKGKTKSKKQNEPELQPTEKDVDLPF